MQHSTKQAYNQGNGFQPELRFDGADYQPERDNPRSRIEQTVAHCKELKAESARLVENSKRLKLIGQIRLNKQQKLRPITSALSGDTRTWHKREQKLSLGGVLLRDWK